MKRLQQSDPIFNMGVDVMSPAHNLFADVPKMREVTRVGVYG